MARHKAVATIQLNLRVTPSVYRELESRAEARGTTISDEVRRLLDQSLGNFINTFEQRVRDAVERSARGSRDPEPIFRRLATLGATLRHLYTDVEQILLPDMTNPEVRALLRGAPALPSETKSKHKPSQ